jgi:hypothetical protein
MAYGRQKSRLLAAVSKGPRPLSTRESGELTFRYAFVAGQIGVGAYVNEAV